MLHIFLINILKFSARKLKGDFWENPINCGSEGRLAWERFFQWNGTPKWSTKVCNKCDYKNVQCFQMLSCLRSSQCFKNSLVILYKKFLSQGICLTKFAVWNLLFVEKESKKMWQTYWIFVASTFSTAIFF